MAEMLHDNAVKDKSASHRWRCEAPRQAERVEEELQLRSTLAVLQIPVEQSNPGRRSSKGAVSRHCSGVLFASASLIEYPALAT